VTPPLVFIHGMYLNASSWGDWMSLAASRGYAPQALSWPFHDGDPAELREHVDPGLGRLTFGDVVASLAARVAELPEKPVLIGHSVGGAAVQKLIDLGLARAGVAISPAPPQGVLAASPTFLRANFPHVNPFAGNRPIVMTADRFAYTFGNTMPRAASDAAFERYVVPESRNVPRSLLTRQARIDPVAPHVPLLMIGGDTDHLVPLPLVRRNAARYRDPVEVRVIEGRGHFLCNEDGWERVAGTAFDWLGSIVPR
jgi:pimeloyl-ACP methyl ester carboxylesterase